MSSHFVFSFGMPWREGRALYTNTFVLYCIITQFAAVLYLHGAVGSRYLNAQVLSGRNVQIRSFDCDAGPTGSRTLLRSHALGFRLLINHSTEA